MFFVTKVYVLFGLAVVAISVTASIRGDLQKMLGEMHLFKGKRFRKGINYLEEIGREGDV